MPTCHTLASGSASSMAFAMPSPARSTGTMPTRSANSLHSAVTSGVGTLTARRFTSRVAS
jgi:hypothetical protein